MRELLTIADRVEDLSKEIPVSSFAGFLEETNRKIRKMASQTTFFIDVFRATNSSSETRKIVKQLQETNTNSDFKLVVKDENNYNIKVFEEIFSSVAFVFLDEEMEQSDVFKQHFRKNDDQYKVIFIVDLLNDEKKLREFSRSFNSRTKSITLTTIDFADKTLEEILQLYLDETALDKLKKISYLNSIKPVFSFLNDILFSENKAANTRKILNSQNTNITRREEQSLNTSELSSNIRQLIQKSAQDLEKNYKLKYDDLNKPNTGKFSLIGIERSNLLADFEKRELAEKSEKVETTIDKNFLNDFIKNISTTIKAELGKDEAFIKSSFEDIIAQINIQLKSKSIQPLNAASIFPPFPEKERTIQSFCYINKSYTGEVIKKGPMEYFVALRDYTGLIMVVGGLLAPLSIVASTSDNAVFKSVAIWVKAGTGAISLIMIVYGIYDLRKRIPLKRVEEFERELAKAKDILVQESKRMFNDSSRDWTTNISNWIKDTTQNINLQIERNMKDLASQKAGQMNQEKVQQQKQQQSIDMLLRSIQSAERVKDQMNTRYRDMVTETEKDLKL